MGPNLNEKENLKLEWFYESNGNRVGPVDIEEVRAKYDIGIINDNTEVWRPGYSDWKKIRETEVFEQIGISTPPPLSGSKVNNSFVWILAFVPVIGAIFLYFIRLNFNDIPSYVDTILFIILNSIFAGIDEYKLKKAGYEAHNFFWAIFLVPVYLWKRATIAKQSRSYFWVWVIVFVLLICFNLVAEEFENFSANNVTTTEQAQTVETKQTNEFSMNQEVTFNNLFSIQAVDIIDPYVSKSADWVPEKGNKFVAVEIIFKNTSASGVDYNFYEYTLIGHKGYSYETSASSICAGKEPAFDAGTLNPNSFRRGWITFEALKDSSDYKLHFQNLTGRYYTDIILKK